LRGERAKNVNFLASASAAGERSAVRFVCIVSRGVRAQSTTHDVQVHIGTRCASACCRRCATR
jgi:hypothetical protein